MLKNSLSAIATGKHSRPSMNSAAHPNIVLPNIAERYLFSSELSHLENSKFGTNLPTKVYLRITIRFGQVEIGIALPIPLAHDGQGIFDAVSNNLLGIRILTLPT